MAKVSKEKKPRKKRGEYEEPLKVTGSFMDIMKAAVKQANAKTPTAKKP